jgi:hypothetical protein
MDAAIRITYRHVLGCLVGDCPSHASVIRSTRDVDSVIRRLTEEHSDFPIEIEGVEDLHLEMERPGRRVLE